MRFILGLVLGFGVAFLHYEHEINLLEVGKLVASNGLETIKEVVQLVKEQEEKG